MWADTYFQLARHTPPPLLPAVHSVPVSELTRFPANESPRRTGLHSSLLAKSSFFTSLHLKSPFHIVQPQLLMHGSILSALMPRYYTSAKTTFFSLPPSIQAAFFKTAVKPQSSRRFKHTYNCTSCDWVFRCRVGSCCCTSAPRKLVLIYIKCLFRCYIGGSSSCTWPATPTRGSWWTSSASISSPSGWSNLHS